MDNRIIRAPRGSAIRRAITTGLLGIGALIAVWLDPGASARAADKAPAWPPQAFPITFWCGPPEPYINLAQYRRIAAAGFNTVMPPCEGAATVERNHKILELCRQTGLKAIISDSRMPLAVAGVNGAPAALKAIVHDYSRSPALLGYFLTDEPGANSFPGLAEVVQALHQLDPGHMVFINLFPNYASNDLTANPSQLNALNYTVYLDTFMRSVHPDVLSWDHYHFTTSGDRPGFFSNLAAGEDAALSTDPPTPMWQIVLSVQHGPYRPLTEDELRFEAMQTIAYGGHGLAYFTYWLPNDPSFHWDHAIMNRDGSPGPLYAPVTAVNRDVTAIERWLYPAHVTETYQTGNVPPDGRPAPEFGPAKIVGGGDLTVGNFVGPDGYAFLLVASRDYKSATSTKVSMDVGKRIVEMLDFKTGRWSPLKLQQDRDERQILDISLKPAGAALLRWQ